MNDNYMKTILSGVKEWTENLTDDAIDKANNALEQANKSIDKALFVVNITENDDGTYSADKTFDEITQAYNEGKYSIVLKHGFEEGEFFEYNFLRLDAINPAWAQFISPYHMGAYDNIGVVTAFIYKNNTIKITDTELAQVPTPYPLTFTGAVNKTYDGSAPLSVNIPSGGGGSGSYFGVYTVEEDVSQYRIPFEVSRYRRIVISVNQLSGSVTSLTIGFSIDGLGGSTDKEGGVSRLTYFMFDVIELTPGALNNNGKYAIYGYSRRSNNPSANTLLQAGVQYVTTEENSLVISGNDGVVIPQGSIITITATP